jgi:hypothetical protein
MIISRRPPVMAAIYVARPPSAMERFERLVLDTTPVINVRQRIQPQKQKRAPKQHLRGLRP